MIALLRVCGLAVGFGTAFILSTAVAVTNGSPAHQTPLGPPGVDIQLFDELEELSRIVDVSYCVGYSGVSKPFKCASWCSNLPNFELIEV